MSYEYSENILVQESAGNLLHDELGWDVKFAYNTEVLGPNGTFGRKGYHEILLTRYFRTKLQEFNPWMTPAQMDEAQRKLESYLASSSLMQINEEKYLLIRDGIPVSVKLPNGKISTRTARIIDFQEPLNNHFLAVKELKIKGPYYRRRTDIVGFVNGLPLLFMEFKAHHVDIQNAYTDNYSDYLDTIPHLFHYNAFLILSNGHHAKVGTLGSKYEFFHEWKRLKEDDPGSVELQTMLRGICSKDIFIDLLENFILYDHSDGRTAKILARNHQYLGVNEAVEAYKNRKLKDGKLGVFWHTQGSGKSYSMLFLAQKIRRKFTGSPTIVILTDRDELNSQISDTFEHCGLLGKTAAAQFIATSGSDLVEKLKGNPSFIFTLIQKFNQNNLPPIIPQHDIIIMSDEAHRSQYGIFAENMCHLLPTASRIGFTGTPLLSSDNITERTFGGYVSIYDFKRAVEDGATVPLYYENRGEKILDIDNPEINDRILDAIENADLDPNQQEKLEREFAKEIHLLTAEPRLDSIAKDFVEHYSDLWTCGKAMFVCLNKVTCVRMFNLAQKYWLLKIAELEEQLKHESSQQTAQELSRKIKWMRETEMAVVISQEQNEIKVFRKWGLDILPHREKMEKRKLDKEFKNSAHPFRVVFVCAMWLTGFDVKSLACLYLDKPLKAHTLMQTIARANRVNEGKTNGLIIDYIGIVKALRKALADYTTDKAKGSGEDPTIDKSELIAKINEIIAHTDSFLQSRDFTLADLFTAEGFEKLGLLQQAADILCSTLETKKEFQAGAGELERLWRYLKSEEITPQMRSARNAIHAISKELNKKRKYADNTDLMVELNKIVNDYITTESQTDSGLSRQFDISKIDFDLLRREFAKVKNKNLVLRDLENLIEKRLQSMLPNNPERINYYDRYREIIEDYNGEQDRVKIEKTFMELMALSNELDGEQQRYIREGFASDEELSVYDLIFKESLSKEEIKKIKALSVELLAKVKQKISELDHWRDKPVTQAIVDNLIRDTLFDGLPQCYDDQSITNYRNRLYEYIYTRYPAVAV